MWSNARVASVRRHAVAVRALEPGASRRPTPALSRLPLFITALGLGLLAAALAREDRGDPSVGSVEPARPAAIVLPPPGRERSGGQAGREGSATPPAARAPTRSLDGLRLRRSVPVGLPHAGRLRNGVQMPVEGPYFFTWDSVRKTTPNRPWRRWGTDVLVVKVLRVLREFAVAHPGAPRVGIGDLSRTHGGNFGRQYGGIGHASHQNGLDVDIYYPRLDRRELGPRTPAQVDRRLSQDLVDRFVRAGAERVFVGLTVRLKGPPSIVQPLPHHDNHLHVRIPAPRRR